MSEIDWNVELRKVERAFDGLPPEPTPEELRAQRAAAQRARQRREESAVAFGAWARLLLVTALAGALYSWPYPRMCGPGLVAYLGAEALIVLGGLWVAVCTWRSRMAKTHGLALMMVLLGLGLLQADVLPRIGYAKVDAANPPRWRCAR
jgi:hypothetical protein